MSPDIFIVLARQAGGLADGKTARDILPIKYLHMAISIRVSQACPPVGQKNGQKKARCKERAESISLEEDRGDRRIMLRCGDGCQFLLMMGIIPQAYNCGLPGFALPQTCR